jgi:Mitochondrial K+-H+ exchange-related
MIPNSTVIVEEAKALPEESPTLFYFPAMEVEHTPELVFFEEKSIKESSWRKASEKGRQLWERLRERFEIYSIELFATDRFIRRLHAFKKIKVVLNRPIDPAIVKESLKRIIRDRSYHHLRWMLVDLILLPFSVFLMPIPGPNVIGYYLLYRTYSHWKSYRSASSARLEDVDVHVTDSAREVGSLFQKNLDIKSILKELRQKYGLRALQEGQFLSQGNAIKDMWRRRKE